MILDDIKPGTLISLNKNLPRHWAKRPPQMRLYKDQYGFYTEPRESLSYIQHRRNGLAGRFIHPGEPIMFLGRGHGEVSNDYFFFLVDEQVYYKHFYDGTYGAFCMAKQQENKK